MKLAKDLKNRIGSKGKVVAMLAMCLVLSGAMSTMAFAATSAPATTSTTIDTSIVTEIISLAKSCMGLFTEFPINIFLYAGLIGIGFGIFRRAKHSAK